jgi:DNA-binding NtrC family response regulator
MKIGIHSPERTVLLELRKAISDLGHESFDADSIVQAAGADVGLVLAEWALNSLPADLFGGLEIAASRVPPIPIVILLSARSRSFAERARAAGAADVLFLPPDPLELQAEIEAVERRGHVVGGATLGAFEHLRETTLIGEDPRFRKCIEELIVAAQSQAHVLLLGETGVGKEMFAQAIHLLSMRSRHHYMAVNCASLPGHLLESELFGHARGAFTGAEKLRLGRFEEVGEGSLLLDEVGDIEPALQMKLLRVIEQREFQRVGENNNIPFRARIMCATSVDLERAVEEGRFRRDLLGRINQLRIVLPPLRERRGDIILLATRLLKKHATTRVDLSESTKQHLLAFDYPMNVRQLENIMISALAHAGTRTAILPRDLPEEILHSMQERAEPELLQLSLPASMDYPKARAEAVRAVDRVFLGRMLDAHSGNQSAAAKALGIDRKTFSQRYEQATQSGDGDELS